MVFTEMIYKNKRILYLQLNVSANLALIFSFLSLFISRKTGVVSEDNYNIHVKHVDKL